MLQQTQVVTVLPYFDRWMRALPDFQALALSPEATVLKLWEGLGYYNRARNLQKLARQWVDAPAKPSTAAEWLGYPGVGPYTAAAIASIAFGESVAVVDGNVVRILARLTADGTEFKDGTSAVKRFDPLAQSLIEHTSTPGLHNEAMMELGATVCLKAKPLCLLCPVQSFCAGQTSGLPEAFPKLIRKVVVQRTVHRLWAVDGDRLLLHRRPDDARRLAGLYELPEAEALADGKLPDSPLTVKKRGIANERIEERIYAIKATPALKKQATADPLFAWVPLDGLDAVILTGPHRKWIGQILAEFSRE